MTTLTQKVSVRLRPYQTQVARAVLDSVFHRRGLTFTVEMARQAGKNEVSAHLEMLLLCLFAGRGGDLVKAAPTFVPQAQTSIQRLVSRLREADVEGLWAVEQGYIVRVGRARGLFFSADRSSHVVGQTAHLLLEVDEAQDIPPEKFDRDFRPMGAATNVTTVLYGTAWSSDSLLEQVKAQNLELERRDGVRRNFRFDWRAVAAHNPLYARYVEAERQRLGEGHPLFRTQYALESLGGAGGLFSPSQRAQLQGTHLRRRSPEPGKTYVAGLDVAGGPVGSGELEWGGTPERGRDSTVLTIAEVDFSAADEVVREPRLLVVEQRWWTGVPHPRLYGELVDVLRQVWGIRRVAVDATGMGEGLSAFLARALGSVVHPVTFTPQTKSRLGFQLLAAVETGRLKLYASDGSPEWQEMWRQVDAAEGRLLPDRRMSFEVDPRRGHDDFVVSLALVAEATRLSPVRQARGRPPLM